MVAIQISELMQGNAGKREDLRSQFIEREDDDDLSAAWLRSRAGELGPLITRQVATVDGHLRESRRASAACWRRLTAAGISPHTDTGAARARRHPLPRRPSAFALGSAGDLLTGPGCPVCRYAGEASDRHLAWFALEAHADVVTITRLCASLGKDGEESQ